MDAMAMDAAMDSVSWNDHLYFFMLYRALNGPDASPSKNSDNIIDVESHDSYYSEADLSAWIREQSQSRKKFLDGKLSSITASQIKVLDSVSFPWILDSSERWDSHFRDLVAFKEKHGHCDVSTKVGKLGIWVKNQRAAYRKLCGARAGEAGAPSPGQAKITAVITYDQVKLLSDIGFQFVVTNKYSRNFDSHMDRLREFANKNGHCRVTPKDDKELYQWILTQRTERTKLLLGRHSKMTDERIAILESIESFTWTPPIRRTEEEKAERKRREKEQREEAKAKKKEERERKKLEEAEEKKRAKEEKKRKRLEEAKEKKSEEAKKREENKRQKKLEEREEKAKRNEAKKEKKKEAAKKWAEKMRQQPQGYLALPSKEVVASTPDAAIHRFIELNLAAEAPSARPVPVGPAGDAETTARACAAAVPAPVDAKPAAATAKAPPMPMGYTADKDTIARARAKAGYELPDHVVEC